MKKKIVTLTSLFLLGTFSLSFAEATFTSDGTSATTTGVIAQYKASKNVNVVVNSSVAGYGAVSDHQNGNRVFATISNDPLLYFKAKTDAQVGTNRAAAEASGSTSAQITGWSSL